MRFAVIALALLLGACEGLSASKTDVTWGYQPQTCQGMNCYWYGTDEAGNPYAVVYSGKEQDSLTVQGTIGGAPFSYEASGVQAFDGQSFQAEVQKIIAAETGLTGRALIDLTGRIANLAIAVATGGASTLLSDGVPPIIPEPVEPAE